MGGNFIPEQLCTSGARFLSAKQIPDLHKQLPSIINEAITANQSGAVGMQIAELGHVLQGPFRDWLL
jgi:hypothetical protein